MTTRPWQDLGITVGRPRGPRGRPMFSVHQGVVVLSVNVSVLLYEPVRSASLAPMCCLRLTATASLEVGAVQLLSVVGVALTSANAPPALACTALGRTNALL